MSLRFKLFAAFLMFIIFPLLLLGIGAYYYVSETVEKNYAGQTELTLRALRQNVDFVFNEMNKVTDSTIASTALQELLNQRFYDLNNLSRIDEFELNGIQAEFRNLLINHPSVKYALLYSLEDGMLIPIYSKDYFEAMPFSELTDQPIYQAVEVRDGKPVWIGPYEYPEITGWSSVFTQIRVVKDVGTLEDEGILLVQIKQSGLDEVFRYFRFNQERYDTRFFIVNGSGLVLYDSSEQINGKVVKEYTDNDFLKDYTFNSKRQFFDGEDSIVSSVGLNNEDWRLVSVASWDSVSNEIDLYVRWVAGIVTISMLLAMIFLLFFVNRIAKTIIRVVRFMRRVEDGELSIRMDVKGSDELHLLGNGLNSLIIRIQYLLGRVKQEQEQKNKAEMLLLQTQIKPHFIFNTLESINVLAVQNEGRKVSQMVLRLANILRISFRSQEEIPLCQEIEHVRSYLEIQSFRFADSFHYSMDIPDDLLDFRVQKLTLQPLVENCIQHGFEGLERIGQIVIRAESLNGKLILSVEDNGKGISGELLTRYHANSTDDGRSNSDKDKDVHNPELRGLGLRSVADRIRIQYGSAFGLMICTTEGHGTTIRCTIPMMGLGDFNEAKSHASGR
ncbi:histidine kinase [Paenibacillus sp. GSMTC-2017]|uniref:cache domain-containing sensor histidine kinase n=1 Tax=Paenibacillus sp. GSMTC-2017 TaxID=2794350 RepID=UPI0018D9FBA8|nr:histidine kinase [Paenibacillus sp. GSMTC-2017]MBH5318871.1 histidine kinase [Paenibacillus sp. GSMTC-2017]